MQNRDAEPHPDPIDFDHCRRAPQWLVPQADDRNVGRGQSRGWAHIIRCGPRAEGASAPGGPVPSRDAAQVTRQPGHPHGSVAVDGDVDPAAGDAQAGDLDRADARAGAGRGPPRAGTSTHSPRVACSTVTAAAAAQACGRQAPG